MSLLDRIFNQIKRLRPERATTARSTYERNRAGVMDLYRQLDAARTRCEIIEVCEAMYQNDPRGRAIITRVADGAVRRGFTLSTAPARRGLTKQAQQAQDLLLALNERADLEGNAHKWLRLAFRRGDLFLQNVIDTQQQIADLVVMPTLEMHRNTNDLDRFDDSHFAYWQAAQRSAAYFTGAPPKHERAGVTWFADFQITYAGWDRDPGQRHGLPLLASGRSAFRRVRDGETDMVVRRRTRAGVRRHHKLKSSTLKMDGPDGVALDELESYRLYNQDVLDNPLASMGDFFTTGDVEIETLEGDARLSEFDDVLHHQSVFFALSPLPMALILGGENLNRDVLRDQYAEYLRALDEVAGWFERAVLRPIFELELLLHGIAPENVVVNVQWAEKNTLPLTVDELVKLQPYLTQETWFKQLAKVLPGFDPAAELEALAKLEQEEMRAVATRDALENALRRRANGAEDDDEGEQAEAAYAGNGRVHSWRS